MLLRLLSTLAKIMQIAITIFWTEEDWEWEMEVLEDKNGKNLQ